MIFRLSFDDREEAAAFRLYCEEEGMSPPVDTSDRHDCPYPKGRIFEAKAVDVAADFVDVWGSWIVSIGV